MTAAVEDHGEVAVEECCFTELQKNKRIKNLMETDLFADVTLDGLSPSAFRLYL